MGSGSFARGASTGGAGGLVSIEKSVAGDGDGRGLSLVEKPVGLMLSASSALLLHPRHSIDHPHENT
jgi:hypothetical protein